MQATAPVYQVADEQRAQAEAAAWSGLADGTNIAEFCASWLALLCTRIAHARTALLLTAHEETGPFVVSAVWPDRQLDLQYLGPVAQRALDERRGVVAAPGGGELSLDGSAHVAYPIEVSGRLYGAVVIDVDQSDRIDLQAALREIHWASSWLVDYFRQRILLSREAELTRVGLLNELMATALQHARLSPSALALANELALRMRCDRVAIGLERDGRVVPLVLSHTAQFDARSDMVRTIEGAMDEVLDLGVTVVFPRSDDDEHGVLAHAAAAAVLDAQALLSVPLVHAAKTMGVITLERHRGPPFDKDEVELAVVLGVMLGPVWSMQRKAELPWWRRVGQTAAAALQWVFGLRNPGAKLIGTVLFALLLFLAFWQTDYRVAARTVVEGSTQIAAVVPFAGFISESLVRAGDTVRKGQILARLDDKDLVLERARWNAEREQFRRKYQVAMAAADRSAMGVLVAQIHQTEAQLALAEDKLARTSLVAPFDGVVVSGDLSRVIGTPVDQGRTLFEIAPLDGFRVVLQVDDRDIMRVAAGQHGELVLSSLPDRTMPFTVSAIMPVATQVDGRNVFRVEAHVEGLPSRLRPGMEGMGKVLVGQSNLLWIWTHRFFDWLRLGLWSWTP
jgi:RND family efflux transporter MFP subunit